MKLWEMLQIGKAGDRFKCLSQIETWNGKIFELSATDSGYCIKRFGQNVKFANDYLLNLCSAALNADWIKLPKPVSYVDFQEAYKAFMNGSGIQSAVNGTKYRNKNYAISFSTSVIDGNWIILED